MDYMEKTFWDMQKACLSFGRKNEQEWNKIGVINNIFLALEANEKELDNTVKAQDENDPSGHVAEKNQQMANLIKRMYKFDRKLTLYAQEKNNKVLLNDVDVTESTFANSSDSDVFIICSTILTRAKEYLSKLTDYNITAEEIEQLETVLEEVKRMPENISNVTTDRKNATRTIKELNADARTLFEKLDNAFEGFIENETFLKGWFDSRKIKGRSYGKKKWK